MYKKVYSTGHQDFYHKTAFATLSRNDDLVAFCYLDRRRILSCVHTTPESFRADTKIYPVQ